MTPGGQQLQKGCGDREDTQLLGPVTWASRLTSQDNTHQTWPDQWGPAFLFHHHVVVVIADGTIIVIIVVEFHPWDLKANVEHRCSTKAFFYLACLVY